MNEYNVLRISDFKDLENDENENIVKNVIQPFETLIFYGTGTYQNIIKQLIKNLLHKSSNNSLKLVEFIKMCSPLKSIAVKRKKYNIL